MTDKYLLLDEEEVNIILDALVSKCMYMDREDCQPYNDLIESIKSQTLKD